MVLTVGTNTPHKAIGRILSTFVRAWQQAGVVRNGTHGRLLFVAVGSGMLLLEDEVKRISASLEQAPKPAEAATQGAASAVVGLPAAVHLFNQTDNSTQRLGWYAAADVHVLHSGGQCCAEC